MNKYILNSQDDYPSMTCCLINCWSALKSLRIDMGLKPWKELTDVFLTKTDALRAVCLAVFKYNSCISEQTENFEKFPS